MTTRDQVEPSESELEEYLAATSSSPEVEAESDEPEEYDLNQDEDEEQDSDESDHAEPETVKPKKSGYVETDDPAVKARLDELTRKIHAERKEKEAYYRELQQYKKEPEPPKEVPTPSADPVTDPEVYAQQMRAREQYVREQVKYEAETEQRKKQSDAAEQAKQERLLTTYNKNIERLKINQEDLKRAADTVTQYGINKELTEFLLEDDDGPAIVKYLHGNVDVLSDLVTMSPVKAAAYIERNIRAKLKERQVSKAPPPSTKVQGTRKTESTGSNGYRFR